MAELKTCPLCGEEAEAGVARCQCGYQFSGFLSDASGAVEAAVSSDRPNGAVPMTIGWVCIVLSILFLVFSLGSQPESYELSPYATPTDTANAVNKLAGARLYQMAAAGFFSLFLVLWSVGYIVKAMSFLPGKGETD